MIFRCIDYMYVCPATHGRLTSITSLMCGDILTYNNLRNVSGGREGGTSINVRIKSMQITSLFFHYSRVSHIWYDSCTETTFLKPSIIAIDHSLPGLLGQLKAMTYVKKSVLVIFLFVKYLQNYLTSLNSKQKKGLRKMSSDAPQICTAPTSSHVNHIILYMKL